MDPLPLFQSTQEYTRQIKLDWYNYIYEIFVSIVGEQWLERVRLTCTNKTYEYNILAFTYV